MSCPGISNPLPRIPLLFLLCFLFPNLASSQVVFSDTKNSWQKGPERIFLKKMGIYSPYENLFFLKRAERKPSEVEHWVIFGGNGAAFTMSRDTDFTYQSGSLIYDQIKISIQRENADGFAWKLMSPSDTLFLDYASRESVQNPCRLFRTLRLEGKEGLSSQEKEMSILTLSVDNEKFKRFELEDLTMEDERFIPFKIMAIFLYADLIVPEQD